MRFTCAIQYFLAPWKHWLSRILVCIGVLFILTLLWASKCYLSDRTQLASVARNVTSDSHTSSERVLRLLDWVYKQHGFSENRAYFVVPQWRATPLQVVEGGGDCADKSRLLWAMLDELGISSTMVMCFDPTGAHPVHTVVEARVGADDYMVVDPVYHMTFPKTTPGYYGLLELRRDPAILPARLAILRAKRGPHDPIQSYNQSRAGYTHATSIHWNKCFLTRIAGNIFRAVMGEEIYRIPRLRMMEEPQLAVAWCAMIGAIGAIALAKIVARHSQACSFASSYATQLINTRPIQAV